MQLGPVSRLLVDQAPLLGLDSLVAGVLIGPFLTRWRDRLGLSALFGLCDGVASLVGGRMPHELPDTPDMLLYGVVVVLAALAARHSRAWLLAAPFILSLDNLATGAPAGAASGLAAGSALLAFTGMAAASLLWGAVRPLVGRREAPASDIATG